MLTRKTREKRTWNSVMMLGLLKSYDASTALLKNVIDVDTKP